MSEFVKTRVKIRADHLAGLVHVHRNQHVGAVIHRQIFTVELIHDHDLVLAVIPGQTTKKSTSDFLSMDTSAYSLPFTSFANKQNILIVKWFERAQVRPERLIANSLNKSKCVKQISFSENSALEYMCMINWNNSKTYFSI